MKATLDKAWAARLKLRDEGRKLYAEGYKLWDEGLKLYAEGHKLCDESSKLHAEGHKLWEAEVRRLCGADALIEYDTPCKGDCTVQGVMVFYGGVDEAAE